MAIDFIAIRGQKAVHTATLIFLHGLGDSGHGWSDIGKLIQSKMPYMHCLFPNAKSQPVSINGGASMPAWYDIRMDDLEGRDQFSDKEGFENTRENIMKIVNKEKEARGIQSDRIVLGGFSQGGAVTLYTLLKEESKFGAGVVLSSYLPFHSKPASEWSKSNLETPIFMAHGKQDNVVPFAVGQKSANTLRDTLGFSKLTFNEYSPLQHSATDQEISEMIEFLSLNIPPIEKLRSEL